MFVNSGYMTTHQAARAGRNKYIGAMLALLRGAPAFVARGFKVERGADYYKSAMFRSCRWF